MYNTDSIAEKNNFIDVLLICFNNVTDDFLLCRVFIHVKHLL